MVVSQLLVGIITTSQPLKKNNGNGEVDRFDISGNDIEYAKNSRKSKSEKTFKFQNLAKSGKKLSKSENSTNFNVIKAELKFLIPNAKTVFNCLRLAFIEAPILQHFYPKYHI